MAEVREPAAHLGHASRARPRRTCSARSVSRQRRAVRRFDLDQELRRIRLGEQAASRSTGTSAADSSSDPPIAAATVSFGPRQAPVQRRAVIAVDHAHHALAGTRSRAPALSSLSTRLAMNGMMNSASSSEPMMVATTAIGSTRMNLPAVPGSASSGRNAKISVAVQPRMATKICRVPSSAACDARLPHAHVPRDVLDDDDRVVHQQAERDDEARDRELVERVVEEIQARRGRTTATAGSTPSRCPRRASRAAAA